MITIPLFFLPRCLQLSATSHENSLNNGSENTGRIIIISKNIICAPKMQ